MTKLAIYLYENKDSFFFSCSYSFDSNATLFTSIAGSSSLLFLEEAVRCWNYVVIHGGTGGGNL